MMIVSNTTAMAIRPNLFFLVSCLLTLQGGFFMMIDGLSFNEQRIEARKEYFYLNSTSINDPHHVQEYEKSSTDDNDLKPDFVYSSDYPNGRIVNFYAHWCPHCKHFQSTYKQLSNKIYDMSTMLGNVNKKIETFAVSCVPFGKLCSDLKIHAYPTVMFYPPNTSINGTKLQPYSIDLRKMFQSVGATDDELDRVFKSLHNNNNKDSTTTGKTKDETKSNIISDHDKQIHNDIEQYKKTHHGAAGAQQQQQQGHNVTGDGLRTKQKQQQQSSSDTKYFQSRTQEETYNDAHLSFDFAMRTAIYVTTTGPLETQKQIALKKFLELMYKTVPVESSMQPAIRNLLHEFDKVVAGPEQINEIMYKHPPPVNDWSMASLQHGTGYTAGLWQLFHIMSVGMVVWNHIAIDHDDPEDKIGIHRHKIIPAEMADVLRNYIEHFFQCEVCRLNFLTMYDACSFDRCNRLMTTSSSSSHPASAGRGKTTKEYIQYPLWLFETHNSVNARLRNERIELKIETESTTTSEMDVIWPPVSDCNECWLSEGRWDEIDIYKHLQRTYWPKDDNSDLLEMLSKNRNSISSRSNLNSISSDDTLEEKDSIMFNDTSTIIIVSCTVMTTLVLWYRKHQYDYDEKGMHKRDT